MEFAKQQREFDRLAEECGSKFDAIHIISNRARKLSDSVEGVIQQSEALSWAVTDKKPKNLKHRTSVRELNNLIYHPESYYKEQYLEDLLTEVEDFYVRESVRESFQLSTESGHLNYRYINGISDENKSRVRILTNMVWYYDTSSDYE